MGITSGLKCIANIRGDLWLALLLFLLVVLGEEDTCYGSPTACVFHAGGCRATHRCSFAVGDHHQLPLKCNASGPKGFAE